MSISRASSSTDITVPLAIIKDVEVYNHIGHFLLELYLKNYFGYDGIIKKGITRIEYQKYLYKNKLSQNLKFKENIGTLLNRYDFLINTKRGCGLYKIKKINFSKFYTDLLQRMDDEQINKSTFVTLSKINVEEVKAKVEIMNEDEKIVEFQRGIRVPIKWDFYLTNMGCFICQQNFTSEEELDNHIEFHGEASEFQSIRNYPLAKNSDFEVTYRTCKNSYLLCFSIKANARHILIDKIVIVRSKWMHYARNSDVPFRITENEIDHFFVDSHLFNIGIPQPIVIMYKYKEEDRYRNIAQYLFVRHEEFPNCSMKLKSTRIISRDELKNKKKLLSYFPTQAFKEICERSNFTAEKLFNLCPSLLKYFVDNKELRPSNITEIFKILLQIEDIKTCSKYQKLYQKNCEINGYCGEYSITVKNIPHNITVPEVLNPYDELILKVGKQKIRCYIYRIYGSKVCFKPNERGRKGVNLNCKYDVSFAPGRIPIIFQFRALEILSEKDNLRQYLFPRINFNKYPSKLSLDYYNESIKINPEQMQAVMNIADGPNNSAPYIIFGPPGTGKTTTIVEGIYQLWKRNKNNTILVTAGSNAACDEVALKLCEIFLKVDPEGLNLLRIYAAAVEKRMDNMDENLLEASNLCHNYHFYPSIESICSYRIVIATLTVVGKLVHGGIDEKFFTHVFIDECAASTEPEALIGIAGILSPQGRLILSGDPKQLGPILDSTEAADLGLKVSLMERLLKNTCYKVDLDGQYDRSIQTRLIRNFRTHSEILHLSNLLYYQNELIPCADRDKTHWALGWNRLPNKNFPVIFNVVYGQAKKDRESTSLFNYRELSVVLDYVKSIMFLGINGKKITENDIGIISPYKRQCNLIREELDKRNWYKIETGSVETFQGKEKPIIIISMVRSNTESVGFLNNPKRLNVTLTRAQALMIIVGNPETLKKVDDWKLVIDYCQENNALAGAKYPRETIDFRMSELSLATEQGNINNNNNKRRRRRYGRGPSSHRRNLSNNNAKKNEQQTQDVLDDNVSINTNFVSNWLESNVEFREKHENDVNSISSKSSESGFEMLNQTKPRNFEVIKNDAISKNEVNDPIKLFLKEINCASDGLKNIDLKTENRANIPGYSRNDNDLKPKSESHPRKILGHGINASKSTQVTLPQQPIKSSTIVAPFNSNSSDMKSTNPFVSQPSYKSTNDITTNPTQSSNSGSGQRKDGIVISPPLVVNYPPKFNENTRTQGVYNTYNIPTPPPRNLSFMPRVNPTPTYSRQSNFSDKPKKSKDNLCTLS